jgi:hypothetical protein
LFKQRNVLVSGLVFASAGNSIIASTVSVAITTSNSTIVKPP